MRKKEGFLKKQLLPKLPVPEEMPVDKNNNNENINPETPETNLLNGNIDSPDIFQDTTQQEEEKAAPAEKKKEEGPFRFEIIAELQIKPF